MADIVIHGAEDVGKKTKKKGRKLVETAAEKDDSTTRSSVVYIGRIPHGFYETQMKEFFQQFGVIKKLRISRNKKTGNSRHYGFIKFESPEVAAIAAESMNNYLLFESLLQVNVLPIDKQHPKMWAGVNRKIKPGKFQLWQKMLQNRVRTPAEQKRQLHALINKDRRRRSKLKAAGIDFDYPDLRDLLPVRAKKIKFGDAE